MLQESVDLFIHLVATAVFLRITHPEFKPLLNITTGATVYFVNLICSNNGGAVYGENGMIHIGAKTKVVFMHNVADERGGTVQLMIGTITFGNKSNVHFANNSAHDSCGGAIFLNNGVLNIDNDASLIFSHNHAGLNGGAIYIESVPSSIIVGDFTKLLLLNNSAFQGCALYTVQSSFIISVGYQSNVQFINNTVFDVGGAAAPCLFTVTDYSAEISFIGNHANQGVGHHMYGTSTKNCTCDELHIAAYKQRKPHSWHQNENPDGYINISFSNPHLHVNEILSPVSSAPQRVCLCDSNGKPQCANTAHIFTHISIYRGETFTLSACVVGYDFGTTVGIVHAGFLNPNHFSQLGQSQDNQPIKNNEKCTNLKYTVLTKHDTEVLLLQTSILPVYKNTLSKFKSLINGWILEYLSHHDSGCLREGLLTTPVFINITLLQGCPPGLTII